MLAPSRVRRVVEAAEAFEDPFAVLGRDAGAVVGDDDLDVRVVLVHGHRDIRHSMSLGVVEHVAERPAQLIGIAEHLTRRDAVRVDGDAPSGPQPFGFLQHEVVEVDRNARERRQPARRGAPA